MLRICPPGSHGLCLSHGLWGSIPLMISQEFKSTSSAIAPCVTMSVSLAHSKSFLYRADKARLFWDEFTALLFSPSGSQFFILRSSQFLGEME